MLGKWTVFSRQFRRSWALTVTCFFPQVTPIRLLLRNTGGANIIHSVTTIFMI